MNYLLRISRYLFDSIGLFNSIHQELVLTRQIQKEIVQALHALLQVNQPDRLLRANEVALLLKITERTVSNWKKSGKLVPVTIGSYDYYRESQIRGL